MLNRYSKKEYFKMEHKQLTSIHEELQIFSCIQDKKYHLLCNNLVQFIQGFTKVNLYEDNSLIYKGKVNINYLYNLIYFINLFYVLSTILNIQLQLLIIFNSKNDSFGVVFRARSQDGQHLAIKKVFQDRRYRNRELQVIQQLYPHEFIVKTVNYYFSTANSQQNGYYLNLIMQYYPENAYQVYRGFARNGKKLQLSDIKLYTYQFLRGLAWMHCFQVTNRDLKPQNTLIDRQSGRAVLCDLGSAKQLNPQEPNIAYICSRYYRAPELVFGSRFYSCVIDVWSFACVVAEMMIGRPLFPGQSPIDQLVRQSRFLALHLQLI
uniref:Kinase, CMGC GSK n=1 Tax=Spironucleus salmonicida TaxID=348837 RepID=V6LEF2_9EUKA|eukprot:EST42890.1 Kinase, CMGC GSK [Spironucleus salmonicida]